MRVPFIKPDIREEDIASMNESIRSGWINPGPSTKEAEEFVARYLGAPHAVMVNSCTTALQLAAAIAGIKEGDEVITTPLTWVTTASIILHQGATAVFADVDPATGLMDLEDAERKITKKTKAIIPVHLYGQMVDMEALSALAKKHGLLIIEDAAHALEANRGGASPAEKSFAAAFSFAPAKHFTSGQGGMLVTHDKSVAERAQLLRRAGVINRDGRRFMHALGHNYISTDFQAALLLSQLKRIDAVHAARKAAYAYYRERLGALPGVRLPALVPDGNHTGHLAVVWVDPRKRDRVRELMESEEIDTSIHYPAVHLEPYYRETFGYAEGMLPNAELLAASTIALPIYNTITREEQDAVVDALAHALTLA